MKFRDDVESSSDSKQYLRLKNNKDSVTGVFRGDPFEFKQHWTGGKSQICLGSGCAECASGNRASFRFRINFVVNESGNYIAKIWEQGATVYRQLRDLNQDYPLEKYIVKITRNGTTKDDTSYSILPIQNGALTPDKEKSLAAVPLQDLKDLPAKEHTSEHMPEHMTEDDIPF